jgi:hypothetical protein
MLPCDAPAGIPALRRSGCPGPPGEAPTGTRPAGRAQTRAPSRTPRHRGSELEYARKRTIGCTTKNAGAPESGQLRARRGTTLLRVAERIPTRGARGTTSARLDRATLPTADPTATHASTAGESPGSSSWQRTGRIPSRTSADRRPSLDYHRGIGHRPGCHRLVPPEFLGSCPASPSPEWRPVRFDSPPHPLPYTGPTLWFPASPDNQKAGGNYTARILNCQSRNAFVTPAQLRAPRASNAP